jgi:SseB protein N-terminal domain
VRVSKPAGDTGEADNRVTEALSAFACGTASEHAALTALAGARLLVPVVAVLAEAGEDGAEKESEMAIPTLVRSDGRRAVIAFTGTESLRRWKDDARPVPVPATRVWAAALAEADAAVIDVAGPVPLAVEGARLRALAEGEPPPLPHEDPDIRAEVAAVTPDFTLGPGGPDSDLAVTLKTADMDHARQIALRLAPRCRRGIEIRTFLSERPRLTPAVPRSPPGAARLTVRGEATRAFGIMIVERRGGPVAWHPFSELTVG